MQTMAEVDRICYQAELDRAERYMNETYGEEEEDDFDYRDCPGRELGECWSCPHERKCLPELAD